MNSINKKPKSSLTHLFFAMTVTAMAAGMGWGIRGQFGHESGAMIAGVLTSLSLVLMFVPQASSLKAARAAAMMAVAIGIGGSMTYGQTLGLTHDNELASNWQALRWGMLGLFIKGGTWIGFGGTFLGMGLGGKRYRSLEMAILFPILLAAMFTGIWLINSPFDPENKILPAIYFSDSWDFEPDAELKPRFEMWGGLLVALVCLMLYVRLFRRDRLATRLALIGFIAGGFGFSGGQCIQAYNHWNPEVFLEGGALGAYADYFRYFNWWGMMETAFGMIFGAILALGLWWNQHLIAIDELDETVSLSPTFEVALLLIHLALLMNAEFLEQPGWGIYFSYYIEYGLLMSTIPLIGIVGGRFWPYMMLLPMVAAPIAAKVLYNVCYRDQFITLEIAWPVLFALPMVILITTATWLICRGMKNQSAKTFATISLLLAIWTYFSLNTVQFQFAWPWEEWTTRTPHQIIFGTFTLILTLATIGNAMRSEKR